MCPKNQREATLPYYRQIVSSGYPVSMDHLSCLAQKFSGDQCTSFGQQDQVTVGNHSF